MSEESIVHIVEEMNTLASSEPLRDACGLIMYEMAQKVGFQFGASFNIADLLSR